ncbi:hypothetical protein COLO4_04317 [Corchorus olitorius]|uniref:Endonuclease/exonuclease/phosphatase n=1 Tax=Corchorus olitorius TaxID=93759 RepID=A0A1R3KUH8_9ROSI|nr:hypothetical protein COLO4_04317 [Corchorus olitorius]
MESQSSNEATVRPSFPDKRDLRPPVREFIELLEGLLCIKYPLRPPIPTPETRRKPILKEGLTQPHIMNALATHGLATYKLPQMLLKEDIPSPIHISLTEPCTRYSLEGYEKQSYMFTASNIVQGSIIIKTEANILSGALSYRIDYVIGKEGALSTFPAASIPFKEPTNLSVLLYNALGADLYSFRKQIESIVRDFDPVIIIITETRLPACEGHQLAANINYMQVITSDPINYNGGIWMFCNLKNLSMKELNHTHNRLMVNLLTR